MLVAAAIPGGLFKEALKWAGSMHTLLHSQTLEMIQRMETLLR